MRPLKALLLSAAWLYVVALAQAVVVRYDSAAAPPAIRIRIVTTVAVKPAAWWQRIDP